MDLVDDQRVTIGLNAPYGARCFLTTQMARINTRNHGVLMHLMALGAF